MCQSSLQEAGKQNVNSIVIDSRSNGGGALTEAVSLSGLFIPSGPIVQVRDNNGKVREIATPTAWSTTKRPLVVLFGRSFQCPRHRKSLLPRCRLRALIVGEPTFGKGRYNNIVR